MSTTVVQSDPTTSAKAADAAVAKDTNTTNEECVVCCFKFDTERYHEKMWVWENKHFVKDSTWCFLFMPLNFGGMMNRATEKINMANASISMPADDEDCSLVLCDMGSPWSCNAFFPVTKKDVPGAEMKTISGTFLTKVYEGPYQNMGSWVEDMKNYVKTKRGADFFFDRINSCEMYAYYTTCPRCAKRHGKNYVVLFAKVA
jgi:hypothetical protein